jgi:hypothetical protein
MDELKACTKCKEIKNISSYSLTTGNNPRGSCKECRSKQNSGNVGRDRKLKFKYKISHQDYLQMLEKQNGACFGCGTKAEDQYHGVLDIDHNHKTGKIRGLLCNSCNRVLGLAGDKPSVLLSLAAYLSRVGSYGD